MADVLSATWVGLAIVCSLADRTCAHAGFGWPYAAPCEVDFASWYNSASDELVWIAYRYRPADSIELPSELYIASSYVGSNPGIRSATHVVVLPTGLPFGQAAMLTVAIRARASGELGGGVRVVVVSDRMGRFDQLVPALTNVGAVLFRGERVVDSGLFHRCIDYDLRLLARTVAGDMQDPIPGFARLEERGAERGKRLDMHPVRSGLAPTIASSTSIGEACSRVVEWAIECEANEAVLRYILDNSTDLTLVKRLAETAKSRIEWAEAYDVVDGYARLSIYATPADKTHSFLQMLDARSSSAGWLAVASATVNRVGGDAVAEVSPPITLDCWLEAGSVARISHYGGGSLPYGVYEIKSSLKIHNILNDANRPLARETRELVAVLPTPVPWLWTEGDVPLDETSIAAQIIETELSRLIVAGDDNRTNATSSPPTQRDGQPVDAGQAVLKLETEDLDGIQVSFIASPSDVGAHAAQLSALEGAWLVNLTATWCAPCRSFRREYAKTLERSRLAGLKVLYLYDPLEDPIILTDKRVATRLGDNEYLAVFDSSASPQAKKLGQFALPTFLIVIDGKLAYVATGYDEKSGMESPKSAEGRQLLDALRKLTPSP